MAKPAKDVFDPGVFLATAGQGRRILEVRKHHTIFVQGDAAEAVFFIQKGSVKLTVVSAQAREAVVGILLAGQFFGEACLDDHSVQTTTAATAMEDCLITAITRGAMLDALHSQPAFDDMFRAWLLARNNRIAEDLADLMLNSSERRLARLLVRLANAGTGHPQPIAMPLSQEELADMIGTTRSRVSFFMNKFRRLGFIDYNGKIEVHDSLNAVLHGKTAIKRQPRPKET